MQVISGQFSKEIEQLKTQLSEANTQVEKDAATKQMMQDNLKKAFMKGVCAMNMEAMSILGPNDEIQTEATPFQQQRFTTLNTPQM